MRCDLHVHTIHSGMCTVPLLRRICRESYNEPLAVYRTLKSRGMDLVTVSDHDSIGAADSLRRFDDFFVSEEVSCTTPEGARLHMGVYDLNEKQHTEVQRRRDDLPSLIAYLREQQLFFSINHAFSGLTGRRTEDDFALFERDFPAMEVRNGSIIRASNRAAASLAAETRKAPLAGSDSHTLSGLGRTYTNVPGARNKQEFMEGLRKGYGQIHGPDGNWWTLTQTVLTISNAMTKQSAVTTLLAPLALLVPAVTLGIYLRDMTFARRWAARALPWPGTEAVPELS
jgi:predicted metal-dependent phosphoesterase TrpH